MEMSCDEYVLTNFNELNKQYNTIKLEKHDIDNYDSLKVMRDEKNKEFPYKDISVNEEKKILTDFFSKLRERNASSRKTKHSN